MPRSPKRNGFIMEQEFVFDEENWPLSNNPPALSLSPTSSNESLMPSTPTSEPILLPGFHFSTTDENVDPAEFHRVAAQLLSGESSIKRDSGFAEEVIQPAQERHLHCDLGKDPSGRHCCSCGKSYSTSLRLREHIRLCAGTSNFPCPTCDKVFETKEKRERHIQQRHNDNKEACPECGEEFPATYLPKHLASGLGGCDGMIQAAMGPTPEIDQAYRHSARKSTSQQYWIYDGDLSWNQQRSTARDSKLDDDEEPEDEVVEQTMSFVKRLLRRPISESSTQACDLCGETFSAEGDELARHIGEHSMDFNEKRHRCDECMIYFANERDLERHLQSVNLNQHCGFTFSHNTGSCSGHHPPTYYKSSVTNDHNLMQKHLWAWELCQLRTHRVTVARLLAERLSQSVSGHMSLQDCRRTYMSLLPHISVASRDSLRSMDDPTEVTEIDAHISRIMSQVYPEEDIETLQKIRDADEALDIRPDSTILQSKDKDRDSKRMSKRKSFVDLAKRKTVVDAVKNGHRRNKSNPIEFLKQQASKEANRPLSLPAHTVPPPAGKLVSA